jgi:TonB family protein
MKKLIIIAALLLAANGHTHDKLFPTCPSPHDPHSADAKDNIQPYKAISKKPPRYPDRALNRGLEGNVILEYTINTEGKVVDIGVIGTTNAIFNKAAIRAAEQFVYEPSINLDTGFPIDNPGVMHRFTFELEGSEAGIIGRGLGSDVGVSNTTLRQIQGGTPNKAIRRIDRYLADEEDDLIRVIYYYVRSLRVAEIEPRNLSKEDLQNAYTLLEDQMPTDPNVITLASYVIPALAFMEMDVDNKKALSLLEEALGIVKDYHFPPSARVSYSYSNLGVLAYNSGNWCRAYESFDAAINTAKKIGMEENPNLKKYRETAKERL